MPKYTEEDKVKAVSLAQETTYKYASKYLGINKRSIYKWAQEMGYSKKSQPKNKKKKDKSKKEKKRKSKKSIKRDKKRDRKIGTKVRELTDEALANAVKEIEKHIIKEGIELAEEMLADARYVKEYMMASIEDGKNEDESNGYWIRSLNGVMDYLIKNAQVLQGKDQNKNNVNVVNQNVQQTTNQYDLSNLSNEELNDLDRLTRKITPERRN